MGDTEAQLHEAYTHLTRIGLDQVVGGVVDVVSAAAHGHACESLPTVDTARVEARLFRRDDDWTLLDVRAQHELAEGAIEGSQHLYLGHLPARWQELDPERAYTVLCASGKRATIAASFLAARGFGQVDVYVGSMGTWKGAHPPQRRP
ncbi:MAG: rhodanese-like domain-containing protein [Planctomycetota bacterium]